MKRKSSLRRTACPMPWLVMTSPPHCLRPGHHGLDDVVVAGAAADVAFQLVANGILVRVRMALHEVDGAHDHDRRAEAALQGMMLAEGFLHRMQLAVRGGRSEEHTYELQSLMRNSYAVL